MSTQPLDSVLVVGGCGFVGYSIVSKLVNEPNCSVSVVSRNPRHPRVVGVSYNACDVTDIQGLRTLIQQIQPQILLHTASLQFYQDEVDEKLLHQVNVVGTRNLLDAAILTESVKAFVYTSSSSVHAGSEFCFIYEERDTQLIPGILALLREKKTHFQLGDNTNLYDSIYVDNAASAHLMAAKALLRDKASRPKVHGEASFITDDNPMPFWDFQRKIWVAAGDKMPLTKVIIVPAWIGMLTATVVEYVFWIFTLGQELPPKMMRRNVLRYAFTNRTFSINKARERLGYRPLVDTDVGIQHGVKWALENRGTQDTTEVDTKL